MKIGIGADHGGFEMKKQLANLLAAEGHQIVDFGNSVYDTNDDYPDFTIPARSSRGTGRRGPWRSVVRQRGRCVCGGQ